MNERAIFWQNKMTQLVRNYPGRIRLMEVCGSHSVAIAKYGLRNLLPEQVSLASGPGCPVCVSAPGFIDLAAQLAKRNDVELFHTDPGENRAELDALLARIARGREYIFVFLKSTASATALPEPDFKLERGGMVLYEYYPDEKNIKAHLKK